MKIFNMAHEFPYEWTLKDAIFTKDKGTVFSTFACGGGSTMGYKLAGFDVIGMNEIDQKMADNYILNHKPKFPFVEPIQTFKDRDDLPEELYNLDILDGSPPCSSFSMSGNREKDWGKEKKFREGQAEQVLDTLFFDFIELAGKLKPKCVISENVMGITFGSAKEYVGRIGDAFDKAGYYVKMWALDGSKMGVPQRRERVFFIAIRKDLCLDPSTWTDMFNPMPKIDLRFNEKRIPFSEIDQGPDEPRKPITGDYAKRIFKESDNDYGRAMSSTSDNTIGHYYRTRPNKVLPTIKATQRHFYHSNEQWLSDKETLLASSYPTDYQALSDVNYLCGMSVPPVMVAQIAKRVYNQVLINFKI